MLAPLDRRAGGTWLGLNADGVFAAVTNLRMAVGGEDAGSPGPDPGRRSRGWVVMDALLEPTAARAADLLKALPEEAYNPFHCFVADRARAFHLVYRDRPRLRELEPGVHVIGNVDPSEEPAPKAERIRRRLEGVTALAPEVVLEELGRVCVEHGTGGGGVGDTCVHLGAYGTRSSLLLELHEDERASRMLYADGAPCEKRYEDLSTLLRELAEGRAGETGETAARNGS